MGAVSIPYTVGVFRALEDERVVKVGLPGVSDVLACYRGRFLGVEVKVGRDTQREGQGTFQEALERAGGLYILARFTDAEDGVATLKKRLADVG